MVMLMGGTVGGGGMADAGLGIHLDPAHLTCDDKALAQKVCKACKILKVLNVLRVLKVQHSNMALV